MESELLDHQSPLVISSDKAHAFHRDGFVVAKGLFDSESTRSLVSYVEEISAMPEVPGSAMFYYEDSVANPNQRVLSRIEYFADFHKPMGDLLRNSGLRQSIDLLFGEPSLLFKEKINCKMPGGQGFEPHQDAQAGWGTFGDLHITALISVDPSTRENGCLEIAAGHHRRGLIGEMWRPMQDSELSDIEFVPVETAPGDVVFFDSFTPHKSAPNLSEHMRRILYVTYGRAADGDVRERYFAEKRANYPPDIERDGSKTYTYKV